MPGFWEQLQQQAQAANAKEQQLLERQMNIANTLQQQQQQQFNMMNAEAEMNKDYYGMLTGVQSDLAQNQISGQESLLDRLFKKEITKSEQDFNASQNEAKFAHDIQLQELDAQLQRDLQSARSDDDRSLILLKHKLEKQNLDEKSFRDKASNAYASQLDWKDRVENLKINNSKIFDIKFDAYNPTAPTNEDRDQYGNIDYSKIYQRAFKWAQDNNPWYDKVEHPK